MQSASNRDELTSWRADELTNCQTVELPECLHWIRAAQRESQNHQSTISNKYGMDYKIVSSKNWESADSGRSVFARLTMCFSKENIIKQIQKSRKWIVWVNCYQFTSNQICHFGETIFPIIKMEIVSRTKESTSSSWAKQFVYIIKMKIVLRAKQSTYSSRTKQFVPILNSAGQEKSFGHFD